MFVIPPLKERSPLLPGTRVKVKQDKISDLPALGAAALTPPGRYPNPRPRRAQHRPRTPDALRARLPLPGILPVPSSRRERAPPGEVGAGCPLRWGGRTALPESRARPPPSAPLRARRTGAPAQCGPHRMCGGVRYTQGRAGWASPALRRGNHPRTNQKPPGNQRSAGTAGDVTFSGFHSRFSRSRLCPVPPPSLPAASPAGEAHAPGGRAAAERHPRTVRAHVGASRLHPPPR